MIADLDANADSLVIENEGVPEVRKIKTNIGTTLVEYLHEWRISEACSLPL